MVVSGRSRQLVVQVAWNHLQQQPSSNNMEMHGNEILRAHKYMYLNCLFTVNTHWAGLLVIDGKV